MQTVTFWLKLVELPPYDIDFYGDPECDIWGIYEIVDVNGRTVGKVKHHLGKPENLHNVICDEQGNPLDK